MSRWNESLHPRDADGQFRNKGGVTGAGLTGSADVVNVISRRRGGDAVSEQVAPRRRRTDATGQISVGDTVEITTTQAFMQGAEATRGKVVRISRDGTKVDVATGQRRFDGLRVGIDVRKVGDGDGATHQEARSGRRYRLVKAYTDSGRQTDRTNGRRYNVVKKYV
jgi:hypothetical protein